MRDYQTWDFYNPCGIFFGLKFPQGLKTHLEKTSTLFVTSPGSTRRGITQQVETEFKELNIDYKVLDFATTNPSFDDLRAIIKNLDGYRPTQILAIGGGSVIDLGKILSYLLSSEADHLEVILQTLMGNRPLKVIANIPFIAAPTTAGTGSEVTPFATLWDMQNKKKYSVATKNLYPQKALLFPELLLSLPWDITLSTGLDALSQCLESIWNKNYTYLTSAIAENGIRLIFESLPVLKLDLSNLGARAKMLEASLFSGLCISKTRTAMAHAISYPLTAHYGTPHGIACSFTLSELWDYNLLQDDGRMAQLSRSLGFKPTEFGSEIFSLLQRLDFSSEFKKTIKNVDQVTSLQSEMFSPGRADNCIRSFDQDSLRLLAMNASNLWLD